MSKKQNILKDLQDGIIVNMFNNVKRYGTSMRSRIAEFRAEGYNIEGRIINGDSTALEYFMPEHMKGTQCQQV